MSRYLAGSPAGPGAAAEPLASLLPVLALRELGELARQEFPALLPLLRAPGPALPAQVAELAPAFHARVRQYGARYGDRTMSERKLETETMRTSEELFCRYLGACLVPPPPAAAVVALSAQAAAELTARLVAGAAGARRPGYAAPGRGSPRGPAPGAHSPLWHVPGGLPGPGAAPGRGGHPGRAARCFFSGRSQAGQRRPGRRAALVAARQAELAGYRAVLIERGSALLHSVILLRELGIPTISNVPGLTRHLRSGQRGHADGRTGEIAVIA